MKTLKLVLVFGLLLTVILNVINAQDENLEGHEANGNSLKYASGIRGAAKMIYNQKVKDGTLKGLSKEQKENLKRHLGNDMTDKEKEDMVRKVGKKSWQQVAEDKKAQQRAKVQKKKEKQKKAKKNKKKQAKKKPEYTEEEIEAFHFKRRQLRVCYIIVSIKQENAKNEVQKYSDKLKEILDDYTKDDHFMILDKLFMEGITACLKKIDKETVEELYSNLQNRKRFYAENYFGLIEYDIPKWFDEDADINLTPSQQGNIQAIDSMKTDLDQLFNDYYSPIDEDDGERKQLDFGALITFLPKGSSQLLFVIGVWAFIGALIYYCAKQIFTGKKLLMNEKKAAKRAKRKAAKKRRKTM